MPRFANCVIMDFSTVIMHINIDKKGTKFAKPGNNVPNHVKLNENYFLPIFNS